MTGEANNNHPLKVLLSKYGIIGTLKTLYSDVIFDYIKGVDTYVPVAREKLFDKDRIAFQNRYLPSTFSVIEQSIRFLEDKIDFKQCNFIDFGSGKGKVLIGAAKFPFLKIKGIEFNENLHKIAIENIKKLKLENNVSSIHGDAMNVNLDEKDSVFYFFNPFNGFVLEACLQSILANKKNDKPRYYIYVNHVDEAIFDKYLKKIANIIIQPGNISVNFYQD